MESYTIGGLAKAAGVSVETVRYYERRGVLTQPPRGEGYRHYSRDDVDRLALVRRAKSFGFTLAEVAELFEAGHGGCTEVLEAARVKLEQVEREVHELQQRAARLRQLVSVCQSGDDDCTSLFVDHVSGRGPVDSDRVALRR
ncbi:MAG: MerR family transcriptional regulator [Acidimicrobiales bacterium]